MQILIFCEVFMHLVKRQFQFVIQNVLSDQIAYFDGHVAFVVVEELAGVVRLDHFLYSDVDQLTDNRGVLLEVGVELAEEGVFEFEVCVEKKGQHGFVSYVDHQAVGLGFAGLLVGEVDKRSEVSHGLDATFVRKVVRANDEAMKRFGNESEAVLWIDSAEV